MKKVFIKTLGCKVNSFDSQALETQFKNKGYQLASSATEADITVINTCSVTAEAEKEARYLARRYKRENPSATRVLTGCYAQIDSAKIRTLEEVDFVVPNEVKSHLVEWISADTSKHFENKFPTGLKAVESNKQGHFKTDLTLFDTPHADQTRTYIKVQDGCNGFCSYCQIPYARGASRSVPPETVLNQVRQLAKDGVNEVILTGIHIGDYGRDIGLSGAPFTDLIEAIALTDGIKRLRISSLEPAEMSRPFVEKLKSLEQVFCDHFHLPLQSGSDKILKLMRRQYDSKEYFDNIQMIREYFPSAHISADVIPGFPQETDEDFEDTVAFIKACGLGSLHVFPYSVRPNTAAQKMPGHIPSDVIRHRAKILRDLGLELFKDFARSFFEQTHHVLWESSKDEQGRIMGKTKNYIKVAASCSDDIIAGLATEAVLKGFCDKDVVLVKPIFPMGHIERN